MGILDPRASVAADKTYLKLTDVVPVDLGPYAKSADFQQVTEEYVLKSTFDAQVAATLARINALEVAATGSGGGTAPVSPTLDLTAGTTLFDRDYRTLIATNAGGTAGSNLTDPSNAFFIKYQTNTANSLGVFNPDNTVTRWYYLMRTAALPAATTYAVRLNTLRPAPSSTVVYPRAVLAADSNTAPTAWYSVARDNVGIPTISKVNSAGASTVLAAGTVANTAENVVHYALFEPTTGRISMYEESTDGTTRIKVVEYTDTTPLAGLYAGVAFRTIAAGAAAGSVQAVNRLTIKTY